MPDAEKPQLTEAPETHRSPEHPFKSPNFQSSLGFAWRGLALAFRQERNLRTHCVIAMLVLGAGLFFQVAAFEWVALTLCMTLMLAVELFNTAIEHLVDRLVQGQYNEAARNVKDISAAACLVTALGVAVAGAIVFIPHLQRRFN